MPNGLKKEDSAALKGLAILMMVFHHCYRTADRITKYQIDLCGLTTEQVVSIAECFKICVAIFAFISGYGLMYSYSAGKRKQPDQPVSAWISSHILSTMSGFWFISAISYIVCYVLKLENFSRFGETLSEKGFTVAMDILGISKLMGTESLNKAWWYMSAAFVFIILLPLLDSMIGKFGGIFCIAFIFIFPRITKIGFTGGSRPYSFLMIFAVGMLCCRYDFFQKFHEFKWKKLKFTGTVFLLCMGFFLYHKIDIKIFWEFRYVVVPFLVILFCVEYLFRIVPLSVFFQYLGRHSMNIWLVHTFVRDWLVKYVFAFKKFWLIPLVILAISLVISYCLDFLKKITGYEKLIKLIRSKLDQFYTQQGDINR